MNRTAPFGRARVTISVAAGFVAFVAQAISVWNTPLGNKPAKIKEANELLEQFRRSIETEGEVYTVESADGRELQVFAHTVLPQSWLDRMFRYALNEQEHKILVLIPEYNMTAVFSADTKPSEIQAELRKKFPPEKVVVKRSWKDVEDACHGLTAWNGLILKARAMQYLAVNPNPSDSYEWQNRLELGQRSFSVCTTADRIRRSVGLGFVVFVIFTPLVWLALLVLAWIWCFSMDRFREPSAAHDNERQK